MEQTDEDTDRSNVIAQITKAFSKVSREGGVSLHEADVLDAYGSDEECAAARAIDTDTKWQEVPESDIEENYSILSFLDPIGFRYYIPAYMVWSLRHWERADSNSVFSTVDHLTLVDRLDLREYHLARFRVFSPDQRSAVQSFLRHMATYSEEYSEDASKALASYWASENTCVE